jgi:hypothetical protein
MGASREQSLWQSSTAGPDSHRGHRFGEMTPVLATAAGTAELQLGLGASNPRFGAVWGPGLPACCFRSSHVRRHFSHAAYSDGQLPAILTLRCVPGIRARNGVERLAERWLGDSTFGEQMTTQMPSSYPPDKDRATLFSQGIDLVENGVKQRQQLAVCPCFNTVALVVSRSYPCPCN